MHTTSDSSSLSHNWRRPRRLLRLLGPLLVIPALLAIPLFGALPAQAAPAVASLSPATGPVGSAVVLTGTIDTASSAFTVRWDGVTGAVLASGTSSASKTVSANFTIPVAVRGGHSIFLIDTTAATSVSVAFTVSPAITLNPTTGPVGTSVLVGGTGFAASETGVTVTWDTTTPLATTTANATGSWTASFAVPATATPTHDVGAFGATTTAANVPPVTFTVVTPQIAVTPATGPVGTTVTISGTGFALGETGISVTYDGTTAKQAITASAAGAWTTTYVIPAGPSGINHVFDAQGAQTTATSVTEQNFVITPQIAITPVQGTTGTSVAITGTGFRASETGIGVYVDAVVVKSDITANTQGGWTSTFNLPERPGGARTVDAFGSVTQGSAVPDLTFTVAPKIVVSPISGGTGTNVTVSGTGFGQTESGITVTFGTAVVKEAITAGANGSWTTTFAVPVSVGGNRVISARGSTTPAGTAPDVNFAVAARITINPASDVVGAKVTVAGASFAVNETGINILFDGAIVASGIVASPTGDWTSAFNVPKAVTGNHRVTAYGNITPVAGVSEVFFGVTAIFTATPSSGYVGMQVALNGSGFAAGKTVAVTFDDKAVGTSPTVVTSDATGSFSATVIVPRSKSGVHKIKVSDGASAREADWTMENTAPAVPAPSSPVSGQRISLFGNVPVTFVWSSVQDPSGVFYSFQVSETPDFAKPIITQDNLTAPSYTTATAETLPLGTYFWRVKTIDGAFNESAWSAASSFTLGVMPVWAFITIIVVVVLVIVAALFLIRRRGSGGGEKWWKT